MVDLMASNEYVFLTHWRVPGTLDQAYDILIDVRGYLRWWSDVYLQVDRISSISAGAGAKARLLTRGKLPYKLRWQAEIIEADRPISFVISRFFLSRSSNGITVGRWPAAKKDCARKLRVEDNERACFWHLLCS